MAAPHDDVMDDETPGAFDAGFALVEGAHTPPQGDFFLLDMPGRGTGGDRDEAEHKEQITNLLLASALSWMHCTLLLATAVGRHGEAGGDVPVCLATGVPRGDTRAHHCNVQVLSARKLVAQVWPRAHGFLRRWWQRFGEIEICCQCCGERPRAAFGFLVMWMLVNAGWLLKSVCWFQARRSVSNCQVRVFSVLASMAAQAPRPPCAAGKVRSVPLSRRCWMFSSAVTVGCHFSHAASRTVLDPDKAHDVTPLQLWRYAGRRRSLAHGHLSRGRLGCPSPSVGTIEGDCSCGIRCCCSILVHSV